MKLFQKLRDLEAKAYDLMAQKHYSLESGCDASLKLNKTFQAILLELPKLVQVIDVMQETLTSISKNSCCELCQEAKLVSLSALEKAREIAST